MTGTKYIPYFDNNFAKGNPWVNKDTYLDLKTGPSNDFAG